MRSDRDTLIGMGFSSVKVGHALASTRNSGLQAAMDWLLEHSEDREDTVYTTEPSSSNLDDAASTERVDLVGELTDGERAKKVLEMQEKLVRKRAERAVSLVQYPV